MRAIIAFAIAFFLLFLPVQWVSAQTTDSQNQEAGVAQSDSASVEDLWALVKDLQARVEALEAREDSLAFGPSHLNVGVILAPIQVNGVSQENLARFRVPLLNGFREAGISVFEKSEAENTEPSGVNYELRVRLSFVASGNEEGSVQGIFDLVNLQTGENILPFEMSKSVGGGLGDLGDIFGGSNKNDLGEPLNKIAKAMAEKVAETIGPSQKESADLPKQ